MISPCLFSGCRCGFSRIGGQNKSQSPCLTQRQALDKIEGGNLGVTSGLYKLLTPQAPGQPTVVDVLEVAGKAGKRVRQRFFVCQTSQIHSRCGAEHPACPHRINHDLPANQQITQTDTHPKYVLGVIHRCAPSHVLVACRRVHHHKRGLGRIHQCIRDLHPFSEWLGIIQTKYAAPAAPQAGFGQQRRAIPTDMPTSTRSQRQVIGETGTNLEWCTKITRFDLQAAQTAQRAPGSSYAIWLQIQRLAHDDGRGTRQASHPNTSLRIRPKPRERRWPAYQGPPRSRSSEITRSRTINACTLASFLMRPKIALPSRTRRPTMSSVPIAASRFPCAHASSKKRA